MGTVDILWPIPRVKMLHSLTAVLSLACLITEGWSLQVLWIGNSYTFRNDVPKTVQSLRLADGHSGLHYDQHTESGWTWEDHAKSHVTKDKINSRKWDVVVIQEQSQRPALDEATICKDSMEPLNQLVEMIRSNNPDTVIQFYDTWARPFGDSDNCHEFPQTCQFGSMQNQITNSYSTFACMNSPSRVAPVGEGFRRVKTQVGEDEFLALYKTHGMSDHHASPEGSYLSACLHYLALFPQHKVVGNTHTGGLDEYTATLMQQIAEDVWSGGNGWQFGHGNQCDLCMCNCSQ